MRGIWAEALTPGRRLNPAGCPTPARSCSPQPAHLPALSPTPGAQDGPTSMPRPRLGSARLKAVETVAALVRVGNADADAALVAAGLVPRCLDLFLRFPFNNLLHHQVPSRATRR